MSDNRCSKMLWDEAQQKEKEKAYESLRKMKALEAEFKKTRKKVIEKTICGQRIKYVKE